MKKKEEKKEELFEQVMGELDELDVWLKRKEGATKTWTITERLAFLRNVEASIRTREAQIRTTLAVVGFALAMAVMMLR